MSTERSSEPVQERWDQREASQYSADGKDLHLITADPVNDDADPQVEEADKRERDRPHWMNE